MESDDLLALSARIIDSGDTDQPVIRATEALSEVAPGVAVVESFSNSIAISGGSQLIVCDASSASSGAGVVASIRRWSQARVNTLVYTHGHLDHVGGSGAFVEDSVARGCRRPIFVAHARVSARLQRYRGTVGWNTEINARQFGWTRPRPEPITRHGKRRRSFASALEAVVEPDRVYDDHLSLDIEGTQVELFHGIGETDDHTWMWLPQSRAVCAGDFFTWNFPNAGNPQKVQRYPQEWARSLRAMIALEPELLLPAHGLPIGGAARINRVLDDTASALESLVVQVLDAMNTGASLDQVISEVSLPLATLRLPYLRPLYDEPEFVVRNIWRLYGGWWDGNPARLQPPDDVVIATTVADLAGGAQALAHQARASAERGNLSLACQLAEWAAAAAPNDRTAHEIRASVYEQRFRSASSLMAKGIYRSAERESDAVAKQLASED